MPCEYQTIASNCIWGVHPIPDSRESSPGFADGHGDEENQAGASVPLALAGEAGLSNGVVRRQALRFLAETPR